MSISAGNQPQAGTDEASGSRNADRLDLLRHVARAGGTINPRRNPLAPNGHEFPDLEGANPVELQALAQLDYLEARYFDRISLCPNCSSHYLNLREVCPACRSTHYSEERLLHHFRCGYVGRESEFATDQEGRRVCPKCQGQLKYLGTDHDQLGKAFLCLECGTSFEEAPASAVCLSCNVETDASKLPSLEIYGYSLTSLGAAAVRRGSLFEGDGEALRVPGGGLYRRTVMKELLEAEVRRAQWFNGSFALMIIELGTSGAGPEGADGLAEQLRTTLRPIDIAGELANDVIAVCLPQTSLRETDQIRTRLLRARDPRRALEVRLAQIATPDDLSRALYRPAERSA